MNIMIEATFENGVLRPARPVVGLSEGQHVWVTMDERQALTDNECREAELIQRLEEQGLVEKLAAPPARV